MIHARRRRSFVVVVVGCFACDNGCVENNGEAYLLVHTPNNFFHVRSSYVGSNKHNSCSPAPPPAQNTLFNCRRLDTHTHTKDTPCKSSWPTAQGRIVKEICTSQLKQLIKAYQLRPLVNIPGLKSVVNNCQKNKINSKFG